MDGQELTPGAAADVQLNGTAEPEAMTVTLTNGFEGEGAASECRLQGRRGRAGGGRPAGRRSGRSHFSILDPR